MQNRMNKSSDIFKAFCGRQNTLHMQQRFKLFQVEQRSVQTFTLMYDSSKVSYLLPTETLTTVKNDNTISLDRT